MELVMLNYTEGDLLDARAVAERIGISLQEYRAWCSLGKCPPPDVIRKIRHGHEYRWKPETIAPLVAVYDARRALDAQRLALMASYRDAWTWRKPRADRGAARAPQVVAAAVSESHRLT
ncbi:hypothetical protein PQR37_10580 [Paraburkholderia nemoris]|uniref:hypothetical protein n=1 Tax=Paraburkholderia nemoris TaxID=2793076 RepID=UPI0038BC1F9A